MADINIDLKKMHDASAKLASKEYMFSNIRRSVGLIRWKLPEELKKKKGIEKRIENVIQQLQIAERIMHEVKTTTNGCISQYVQADRNLNDNAKKFK